MIEPVSTAPNDNYLAALDIGSNSFHYVLARFIDEKLQIVHSEKYRTQLALGLNEDFQLSKDAISRGVETLKAISQATQEIVPDNFKIVATYTLRQAKNSDEFLKAASDVFPYDIEVVSGHEEARLIHQGVAFHHQSKENRLVVDIGGGSTECIIGHHHEIKKLDSLNMGCVSFQKAYFPNGKITNKAFKKAINAAELIIDPIVHRFQKEGWKEVVGTSGTIKTVFLLINQAREIPHPISLPELLALKDQLVDFADVNAIDFIGLKDKRRAVICGGVAVLIALFRSLEIGKLEYCQYALREGVLFELLDSIQVKPVRERTIDSLVERFNIDQIHSNRVIALLEHWYKDIAKPWKVNKKVYKELLFASAKVHEVGMNINTSSYQKHGYYTLINADLAGFSVEQQQALALLVGSHRKKMMSFEEPSWHLLSSQKLIKLCALLRMSVLLCQQRQEPGIVDIAVTDKSIMLNFKDDWLADRPLMELELESEKALMHQYGINFTF